MHDDVDDNDDDDDNRIGACDDWLFITAGVRSRRSKTRATPVARQPRANALTPRCAGPVNGGQLPCVQRRLDMPNRR